MSLDNLRATVAQGSIGSHATLIAFFTIITKLSGFVRDRIFAHELGAGRVADMYYAAFKIPDFIFNIVILGALSSAFIPIFIRAYRESAEVGYQFTNSLLTILGTLMALFVVAAGIFMPPLTRLIVPGFSPVEHTTVVLVSRLMLTSVLFFSISNVMGGVLNAFQRFIAFSISPLLYNLGIILGIIYFYPHHGIYGLALGVIVGSILHCVVQCIAVYRLGWRFHLRYRIDQRMRTMISLLIPRIVSLTSSQLNLLITTSIISYLTAGSLAMYTYAFNIQSLPVSIIGVSFALAAFPAFSYSFSEGNVRGAETQLIHQMRRIIYITLPIAAFLLLLRAHVVRVILGSGAFDWNATYVTAQTLGYFSLSLVTQSLTPLLARFFFAAEDTKTPTIVTIISVIANILLAWILARNSGVIGVAAAFSVSSALQCLLMYCILLRRHPGLRSKTFFKFIGRTLIMTAVSALLVYSSLAVLAGLVNNRTFIGIFLQGALAGLSGILVYALLSAIYAVPEFRDIERKARAIISTITPHR